MTRVTPDNFKPYCLALQEAFHGALFICVTGTEIPTRIVRKIIVANLTVGFYIGQSITE